MPYTKGASNVSGAPYAGPGSTATNQQANNWETQYDEATSSFEQDLLTAFVLTGGVGTIHGGLPKQMDVTTCVYFPLQTDGTLRRRVVTATNFTTVTASTTYFLDYNPDGTTSWGTAHSGTANYLPIASVTTDGSGNILVITDARQLFTSLLVGLAGGLTLPPIRGLAVFTPLAGNYDAIEMGNSHDGTYTTFMGSADPSYGQGAGAYLYDGKNAGYIYSKATKNGITFAGTVTVGGLNVAGLMSMATGTQDTGYCGGGGWANAASQAWTQGVNFHMRMTNIPSSITLNATSNVANNAPTVTSINLYGFIFKITSTGAASDFNWLGSYTTVGNCLLAVDAAALTFDHHCDTCGHVREGLSLATDLLVGTEAATPGAYSLSVSACPQCGGQEHLYTGASSEDEAGWDDGRAVTDIVHQYHLVREAQAALGLPMAQ